MKHRWIRPSLSLMTRMPIDGRDENMKKFWKAFLKALGKILMVMLIGFVATFTLYITNGENKLIYYVIRPFLNKHYDAQVRDRRI